MKKVDLKNCESKKHYACGLVECEKEGFCEFSIDCADAGKFCRHPSVKYTDKMEQALIEISEQEKADQADSINS